jgi:hypothetical protein
LFEPLKPAAVPRVTNLSAEEFTECYKAPGKPVIIADLMAGWPATQKWSLDYLRDSAGELMVPVYSSKPAVGKNHQHAAARHIALKEYLTMLEFGENDLRMFFYNILQNMPHLINDFSYPELGMTFFKHLPVLFVGGKGTRVQMHYDIDLANLILCHFGGPKTVLLFPPDQTPYLYKVPYSFSALHSVNFYTPDFNKHPALKQAQGAVAHLQHGDALFIPSGYWHYIVYEEIGFSMTLRSMPTDLRSRMTLLKNIFWTRTIEGMMRKVRGQHWVERNERLALEQTHNKLGIRP